MTVQGAGLFRSYGPALIGAAVAVALARFFPFAPVFLVPMGVVALGRDKTATIVCVAAAFAVNLFSGFLLSGIGFTQSVPVSFIDSVYFSLISGGFVWAVFPRERPVLKLAYRLSIASVSSSLALAVLFVVLRGEQAFDIFIRSQAEMIAETLKAAAGADVVQRSLLEQSLDIDAVARFLSLSVKRGAVVAHALFFAFSWRLSFAIVSLRDKKLREKFSFADFKNDPRVVWLLIGSLLGSIATLRIENEVFSIISWNSLFLCALLYFSQGCAVVIFNLRRPSIPRLLRPFLAIVGILILLQPGINAFAVIAFAVIGIAENWLPLRAPIKTEPPPTPEA